MLENMWPGFNLNTKEKERGGMRLDLQSKQKIKDKIRRKF